MFTKEGVEDQKEKKEWAFSHPTSFDARRGLKTEYGVVLPALPGGVTCTANVMNTPASIICRVYIETTPTAYEVRSTEYKKDYLRDDQKRLPSILINLFDQGQPSVFFHTKTAKLTGRGNPQILVILHSTRSSEW